MTLATDYQDWGASAPKGVEAHFYSECDSTNTLASAYARSGAVVPRWFVAGAQTSGRGRKGRVWTSKPGNLYASLALRPNLRPADLAALPFIVALAIRDSLVALGCEASAVQCKWPNDVLLEAKKVSGTLIESSAKSADLLDYLIIGIGINLAHFPEDAQFKATSVRDTLGYEVPVKEAFSLLAHKLKERLDTWDVSNFAPIRQEWLEAAWGMGQTRSINTAQESYDAKLTGLDQQGGLLVQLPDGTERTVHAADVFPVETSG